MPRDSQKRPFLTALVALAILMGIMGFLFIGPVDGLNLGLADAQSGTANLLPLLLPASQDDASSSDHPASDLACRSCHSDTQAVIEFPSGETLPAQVLPETLAASAHGDQAADPLACTSCHAPAEYQFPHPPVEEADVRSFAINQSQSCERCHQDPHITSHPGPEAENPVVCTDCHSSHDVLTVEQLRDGEGTNACVDCHVANDVQPNDAERLTQLIQNGMFAQEQVNNDYCLSCHSLPDLTYTFANGDILSLTVDAQALHDSVHGMGNEWQELACTDCHEGYKFPHEPITAPTGRDYSLMKNDLCARCHEGKAEANRDSVHGAALEAGVKEAAVCTDCHGYHDTPPPSEPRARISHTCEQCHSTIFNEYAESVHGEALLLESNEDVPTCIECHGVHNITDPTTTLFRVRSPELCAECHANEELMAQYDISTDVFETYVDDFHGTTVQLFDTSDPNAMVAEAVCYDCHGVHNIKRPDDPDAGIKTNLLETCQQCHPDATANFPDAWTSHFEPSLEHNPLVYLVNLFYRIVIPFTVAFFALLVSTDVYRRIRTRGKQAAHGPMQATPQDAAQTEADTQSDADTDARSDES